MSALVRVILALGTIVGAPDANPSDLANSAAPSPPSAEALFHEGLKAYDAHDYGVALKLFQDAYSNSHEPEILFDIGQTFRALGNCREAIAHFDAFIAAVPPDDPLLPRVRSRRADLLPCGEAATAVPVPTPVEGSPPSLQAIPQLQVPPERAVSAEIQLTPARPVHDRGGLRTACIGSAAGTLVLALAGGVLGIEAYSTAQTVELSTVWDQTAATADERGRTLGQIATTLFISAGATAAVAAVTCSLGWLRR